MVSSKKQKAKKKSKKAETLKINGDFADVLRVAVSDNPKPAIKKEKKKS